jgi:hypothetical protein
MSTNEEKEREAYNKWFHDYVKRHSVPPSYFETWKGRAALRAESEPVWISVQERLPPKGERLMLCNNHGGMAFGEYGEFESVWDGKYEWDAENYGYDGDSGKMDNVTHWMPLPTAPQTEPKDTGSEI